MKYIGKYDNAELFKIMHDMAINTLTKYNSSSFYDEEVYKQLIKFFGQEKTDLFLHNYYQNQNKPLKLNNIHVKITPV